MKIDRNTTGNFSSLSFLDLGMKYELILTNLVGLIFIYVFGLHLASILKEKREITERMLC